MRDWLYVEDHARALDLIAERGRVGETYNVGGRNERRNIDVVRRICAVLDELAPANRPREELIEFVTDRPGHDARYAIDATKLEDELGWRAQENFDTGIEKTVHWYLDNEWWWRPLRERYAGERLGLLKSGEGLSRRAHGRHRARGAGRSIAGRASARQPGIEVVAARPARARSRRRPRDAIVAAIEAARPDVDRLRRRLHAVDKAESEPRPRLCGQRAGAAAVARAARRARRSA